jgi:uncharacterized protein YbbC (DUF1343 family)
VRTGAQVLADEGFARFRGQRVGLIVNHTARIGDDHLIDRLHGAPGVTLAAIFGPEHGYRGEADAGAALRDGQDIRTGVPVYSLYGQTRKPTPAMLQDLDVLVFDIQDVGARFYTYISTMGLAMQAAAEAHLPFVVLDRPNPLGGDQVSGYVLDPAFTSFIGQYPIPVQHGLTVGELARMIQGERLLPGLEGLRLEIVPMQGWTRTLRWPAVGLPWVPTSPNIPDFETALVYPGTCFFEGTRASEGRGTRAPFRQLGASWADGDALAAQLNRYVLPGVRFEAVRFTPQPIEGMSTDPKLKGTDLGGIRYIVTDPDAFRPVETGVYVLHAFYQQAPASVRGDFFQARTLGLLAGTDRLQAHLTAGATPQTIIASWQDEVAHFLQRRRPYLLYP